MHSDLLEKRMREGGRLVEGMFGWDLFTYPSGSVHSQRIHPQVARKWLRKDTGVVCGCSKNKSGELIRRVYRHVDDTHIINV